MEIFGDIETWFLLLLLFGISLLCSIARGTHLELVRMRISFPVLKTSTINNNIN